MTGVELKRCEAEAVTAATGTLASFSVLMINRGRLLGHVIGSLLGHMTRSLLGHVSGPLLGHVTGSLPQHVTR